MRSPDPGAANRAGEPSPPHGAPQRRRSGPDRPSTGGARRSHVFPTARNVAGPSDPLQDPPCSRTGWSLPHKIHSNDVPGAGPGCFTSRACSASAECVCAHPAQPRTGAIAWLKNELAFCDVAEMLTQPHGKLRLAQGVRRELRGLLDLAQPHQQFDLDRPRQRVFRPLLKHLSDKYRRHIRLPGIELRPRLERGQARSPAEK